MEQWTTAARLRAARRRIDAGRRVGLVPTQGALHEGHLSLVRRARAECDVVAVSAWPNPGRFPEAAAFEAFPRDPSGDARKAADAGADLLFAPEPVEMFPGDFATKVAVDGTLARLLEGAFGRLEGFATGLVKEIALIQPDRLYLGENDWQRLKIAETLVRDLCLPLTIVACPTVREADGLAVSRAGLRLSPADREKARVIPYLLATAQDLLDSAMPETQTDRGNVLEHWLRTLLESSQPTVVADYVAVVDPETLVGIDEIADRALVALAVWIGEARLTDCRIIRRR